MAKITKDTIVADVLVMVPESVPLLAGIGMHCLGCPSATRETLGEACASHGVDVDEFLAKVNTLVKE